MGVDVKDDQLVREQAPPFLVDERYEVYKCLLVDFLAEEQLDFPILVFIFFGLLSVLGTKEFDFSDVFELVFGDVHESYSADVVPSFYDLDLILLFDDGLGSSKDDIHVSHGFSYYYVRFFNFPLVQLEVTLIFRLSNMENSKDERSEILTRLIKQKSNLPLIRRSFLFAVIYDVGLNFSLVFVEIIYVDVVLSIFIQDFHSQGTVSRHVLFWCLLDFLGPGFFGTQYILYVI